MANPNPNSISPSEINPPQASSNNSPTSSSSASDFSFEYGVQQHYTYDSGVFEEHSHSDYSNNSSGEPPDYPYPQYMEGQESDYPPNIGDLGGGDDDDTPRFSEYEEGAGPDEVEEEEEGHVEGENVSESASVLTLYLTHQEENNLGLLDEEGGKSCSEESQGDSSNPSEEEKLHFTPMNFVHKVGYRASTAPARPLTDLEEFRRSNEFLMLENAAISGSELIQRADNKFDLDSTEGQKSCKKFLAHLETLSDAFKVICTSRKYRNKFSQAYKVLYQEGSLCYLTEILDSAQEGFPYLWVNGEKYVFSKDVITAGENLFESFCKTKHVIRNIYNRMCEENVHTNVTQIINDLRETLEEFDLHWVNFEQLYVLELMLIESDARRYIIKAIELEKEINSFEMRERLKGKIVLNCPEYNEQREKFASIIGQINAVANTQGKGRDDLTAEILIAAEGISRRISDSQSHAVRRLADQIKLSFKSLRELMRKYGENIEVVDPQLKNNPELVEALAKYEATWEKGKGYFVEGKTCNQLIRFSQLIEGVAEKYKEMHEQIECMDTDIFVSIPCLLVLKALDNDDKGICESYYPPLGMEGEEAHIYFKGLQEEYAELKSRTTHEYELYNLIEQNILDREMEALVASKCKTREEEIAHVVHGIKRVSMGLQRYKPSEWNAFMDVAIGN